MNEPHIITDPIATVEVLRWMIGGLGVVLVALVGSHISIVQRITALETQIKTVLGFNRREQDKDEDY